MQIQGFSDAGDAGDAKICTRGGYFPGTWSTRRYNLTWLTMADILIEEDRAQRILARILRDDLKLPSDRANSVASSMRTGMLAAMTTPSKPRLQGWRIIDRSPPFLGEDAYLQDVRKHIAGDADWSLARELWKIVWNYGRDLPPDIAPPSNY
jgi:hypothetical protein